MELAEVTALVEDYEKAVGFAREAREAAAGMMPLYQKWAANVKTTNPTMTQEAIDKTLEGVETNMNYLRFERTALVLRRAGEEKLALELMLEGLKLRGEDFKVQRMLTLEYNVIRPEESLKLIGDLQAILGNHEEAAASYEKAAGLIAEQYPEGHPAILDVRESEALLAAAKGDLKSAESIAASVLDSRMENLENVLAFASESQRLAYRDSIDPWSLFASLNLPEQLYTAVIRSKGIVLESILEDRSVARQASDPKLEASLEELRASRRQLMEILMGGAEAGGKETATLRKRITKLESSLSDGVSAFGNSRESLETTVREVAGAVPKGSVLIDYIRYRDYAAPGRYVNRFGAVVLEPKGSPVFVPLAEASKVDAAMEVYAKAVRAEVTDDD
ncbi:MAG: tetratricopeptide repeat protein, partial [Planctomycetota bacterium]